MVTFITSKENLNTTQEDCLQSACKIILVIDYYSGSFIYCELFLPLLFVDSAQNLSIPGIFSDTSNSIAKLAQM
jgi:hypothetical protein